MKLIRLPILLAVLSFALISSGPIGCSTTGANTGQTVQKVSLVLRTAANAGAVLAIKDNPDNRKHVELAVTILDQLLVSGSYKPGELVAALEPVIKELRKPEVNLAVNTALNLYEGLYGDYVRGKIGGNENAQILLTALRDGARAGLVPNSTGLLPPPAPTTELPVKK